MLVDQARQKLVDRIARIIDEHREAGTYDETGAACRCGAHGLTDQSRHVAEQVIDQLGFVPQDIDDVKKRLRYVTSALDWELTKLEGAQG